jgi:hypothetical protein
MCTCSGCTSASCRVDGLLLKTGYGVCSLTRMSKQKQTRYFLHQLLLRDEMKTCKINVRRVMMN